MINLNFFLEYQVMDNAFPNDPVHWPETMSNKILTYLVNLGSCQPLPSDLKYNKFPTKNYGSGNIRSFHESHYFQRLPDGNLTKRTWLSYSPLLDRVFCMSCRLFGLVKAKKSFLSSKGTCDYRNIAKTIHHYECLPEHIQSEISRGLYFTRTRIDITLLKSANHQVAENREILKVIIDALLFTARQNIVLRGHDESNNSMNKGNFLELLKLLSKHHGPLNSHLQKIEGKNN